MNWTKQQEDALVKVRDWLRDPYAPQVFRLFGFAGTGKTTLARHLVEGEGLKVQFGAYTGKAALVLRQKGCVGAKTIHSLMYRAKEKDTKLYKSLERLLSDAIKSNLDQRQIEEIQAELLAEKKRLTETHFSLDKDSKLKDIDLIVIDECSMVGKIMGRDLESFGKKILVLGDPAQLPPIHGLGYFERHPGTDELIDPDVLLTDVQRQARDNPIVDLATRVRNGERLSPGQYGESSVVSNWANIEDILDHDQVLVGRNETRRWTNARIRHVRGFSSVIPQFGDRLICLRNDHEAGILNGGQFIAAKDSQVIDDEYITIAARDADGTSEFTQDEPFEDVAHVLPFLRGDMKDVPYFLRKRAQEFDYGYAITVHKSQGSQWNSCYILDDWTGNDHDKWLYTAITRAAEKVTIIQDFNLNKTRKKTVEDE